LEADEEEAEEGRILNRVHRYRERDRDIVTRKKDVFLKQHGRLCCEACSFDFALRYGSAGDGFIECHHTRPASELKPGDKTKMSDLALLCSNCHRMGHRKRPWLSLDRLRDLIRS
jgi:5-methylcytosine-specific restriction protein A